jgi:fructose-1,6-bisphosphatase/inositol monophosphatase family enzyme
MDSYLDFATSLSQEAGKLIYDGFTKSHTVTDKVDNSPVTEVDLKINQLVIDRIKQKYPSHGLLGEEANMGNGRETMRWICDPLDGTKSFILKVPNSVFIIALMEETKLILGVIYNPFTKMLYHAEAGQGAYRNGEQIKVNTTPLSGGYVLLGSSSYPFVDSLKMRGAKVEPVSGGGYKYAMIADGRAVGTIKDGADFHDVAAGTLIIQEAGGMVTDLDGSPLKLDEKIAGAIMSNGIAHDELITITQHVLSNR